MSQCQHCGACCAAFRVAFYWAETSDAPGGWVPASLTESCRRHERCMIGTAAQSPHCIALVGQVGTKVGCAIYAERPSPCRELQEGSAQCAKARIRYGLPPLAAAPENT